MVFNNSIRIVSEGSRHVYKSILPGGFVVIFAYGYTPTFIDKAHVKIVVTTTAFTATASTKADRTICNSLPGYTAGFLEKSLTDWWSKNVIHVSSTLERRTSMVKYEYKEPIPSRQKM